MANILDYFSGNNEEIREIKDIKTFKEVPGLYVIENFITKEYEKYLLDIINKQEWSSVLSRRVQHYYRIYNYSRKLQLTVAPEPPEEIKILSKDIENFIKSELDLDFNTQQIIVNEYKPGQGIAAHIDRPELFGPIIISLSLGSDCTFSFKKDSTVLNLNLKKRTLVIMTKESRYSFTHDIPKRSTDRNGTRVSITFRTINPGF